MRRGILIILVMLLCTSVALAESLVTHKTITNQILPGEEATFELEITNDLGQAQRYSIYSLQSGQGWNVDPEPLRNKIIEIQPKETRSTLIKVRPLKDFSPGVYGISLSVDSDFGEKHQQSLEVFLAYEGHKDYLPTIQDSIDMDEKIKPGEALSVRISLQNRNPLDMKDLKIRLESDIKEFQKEVVFDLEPLERKTIEFALEPNKYLQPKDYTLFFVYELNGEQVKVVPRKFEVQSLSPSFTKEVSGSQDFLRYYKTLKITNDGNVKNSQKVVHPITLWQSLFTFSEGVIEKTENGRFITWDVSLSSRESMEIKYTTNYRSLLYLAIITLVLVLFYLIVRSPILVRKKANATKSAEGGSLSELKITLEVRNKSSKQMKHISVIDFVPAIGNVEKSIELGTLKPNEVRHTKKGTKVHWNLAELDAHEHRIITYKVKAKLNILGTFVLPRATVEFNVGERKRKQKAYSNVFKL
jgi:uncharacterized membrane protein